MGCFGENVWQYTPVGAHDAPAVLHGHGGSLDGLSDGTNLVNLEQESVASLLLDTGGDTSSCRRNC